MRKVSICSMDNQEDFKFDNFCDFVLVYQEFIEDVLLCDVRDIYQLISYTRKTNDKLRAVFDYVRSHGFDLKSFFDYVFRCSWKRGKLFPDIYFLYGMLKWRGFNKAVSSSFPRKLVYEKEKDTALRLMERMEDLEKNKILLFFLEGKNSPYLASYLTFFHKYGSYNMSSFSDWKVGSYFENVFVSGKIIEKYTRLRDGIVESGWKEFLKGKGL